VCSTHGLTSEKEKLMCGCNAEIYQLNDIKRVTKQNEKHYEYRNCFTTNVVCRFMSTVVAAKTHHFGQKNNKCQQNCMPYGQF
jgi:hypothetical protein